MADDSFIVGRLYVPLVAIVVLGILIYFHRRSTFKYLYMFNIFLYMIAIFSYFILINHPVGEKFPNPLMAAIPFVLAIAIFEAYLLSILSVSFFVFEEAQRHLWAKIVIGIAAVSLVLCGIGIVAWVVLGILSLNSG
jgi:hypothetical protein